ncbi:OB-fold domain-containing protein [soil metagenome]
MTASDATDHSPSPFGGAGPEARYRQKLSEGIFEIQRCSACSRHQFYPRVTCRYCGSASLDWVAPSGKASVYSTTVVRRKPADGGDYNVAIVMLQEGPRMMSRVDGIEPTAVTIGQAVTARINGLGADALLVFVPDLQGATHGQ